MTAASRSTAARTGPMIRRGSGFRRKCSFVFTSPERSARLRGLSRAAERVLSSAVEHRPYKARVGGSKPSAPTKIGAVVQLVRIPACHAGGRGFESRPLRQFFRTEALGSGMLQRIRDGHAAPEVAGVARCSAPSAPLRFLGRLQFPRLQRCFANHRGQVDGDRDSRRSKPRAPGANGRRAGRASSAPKYPPNSAAKQQEILDSLVMRTLMDKRLKDAHYRVSDAMVLAEFQNDPGVSGAGWKIRFGVGAYRSWRRTTRSRSRILRRNARANARQPVAARARRFVFPDQRRKAAPVQSRERRARGAVRAACRPTNSRVVEPIDDAAVKAYYDKNGDRFMTTESVALEYAELRLEQLASQVAPTEADLQKLYDENRAQLRARRAPPRPAHRHRVERRRRCGRPQEGRGRCSPKHAPARISPNSRRNIPTDSTAKQRR